MLLHPTSLVFLGVAYQNLGDAVKGEESFKKAIHSNPELPLARQVEYATLPPSNTFFFYQELHYDVQAMINPSGFNTLECFSRALSTFMRNLSGGTI